MASDSQKCEINEDKVLGAGAYGKVCEAKYGQLPCAAKLLLDIMLEGGEHSGDPGRAQYAAKFEEECQFLSKIKHPNIVQYLGTYRNPQSQRLALLMELMDESLTRFLERSTDALPYHVQLNICHDVGLALSYLHSNAIIHRDLSSNNVLLIGEGNRAKVTDFGMSKLMDMNPRKTPLTVCPGAQVYMPPEALITPAHYSNKLDCFSHGVLTIQILTRNFPKPGDAHRLVEDRNYPTGHTVMLIPETERRKEDIDLVEPNHPLLPLALRCLHNRATERPLADEMCERLATLRKEEGYTCSVKKKKDLASLVQTLQRQLVGKCQELKSKLEQKDVQFQKERAHYERELQHLRGLLAQRERDFQVEWNKKAESGNQQAAELDEEKGNEELTPLFTAEAGPCAHIEKFRQDCIEVLSTLEKHSIPMLQFPEHFNKVKKKQLVLTDYKAKKLMNLLEAVPETVQVLSVGDIKILQLCPSESRKVYEKEVEVLLYEQPNHTIALAHFMVAYKDKYSRKMLLCGHSNLTKLLRECGNTIEITGNGPDCQISLTPLRLLACELTELLLPLSEPLLFNQMAGAYMKKFNREFNLSKYGFSKFTKALEALQDLILIEGAGASLAIKLKYVPHYTSLFATHYESEPLLHDSPDKNVNSEVKSDKSSATKSSGLPCTAKPSAGLKEVIASVPVPGLPQCVDCRAIFPSHMEFQNHLKTCWAQSQYH